jgi:short-subunit dehydrogenase
MPPLVTHSAEQVAREAYEGFMRGKRVVVPGILNKMIVGIPRLLPRALLLRAVHANQVRAATRERS